MYDPNVLQFFSFPLPNCGTPPHALFPPSCGQMSSPGGAHTSIWMASFRDNVRYWSSMTDKATIDCRIKWSTLVALKYGSVQTLSDTNGGFQRACALVLLLMWSRFLFLSHWCSPTAALRKIIKYFSNFYANLSATEKIISTQKYFYSNSYTL